MNFQTPLYQQRHQCIYITKASCIKLNNLISSTSKNKVWKDNFNPYKVNIELRKHFNMLRSMITELSNHNYNDFVDILEDSCFNRRQIIGSKYFNYRYLAKVYFDDILQRLLIIYSILYVYVCNNSYLAATA